MSEIGSPQRPVAPTVVYVAGWGRSGSTLLGRLLGELDGFVSVGELHYLWGRGLRDRWPCGCGLPVDVCPFWAHVLDEAFADSEAPDPAEMAAIQRDHLRLRQLLRLRAGGQSGDELRRYSWAMEQIYRAIATVSGASFIVDSSKEPADALIASRLSGVELFVIHLVRDPRAVAYSWSTLKSYPGNPDRDYMKQHGSLYSSTRWSVWNAAARWVVRPAVGHARFHSVRYEDLVIDPVHAMHDILSAMGTDRVLPFEGREVVLNPSHTVGGNPDRLSRGRITVAPDERWKVEMSRLHRAAALLPALPLMPVLGYPRSSRRSRYGTVRPTGDPQRRKVEGIPTAPSHKSAERRSDDE